MTQRQPYYSVTTRDGNTVECLDVAEALSLNLLVGQAFQYIWRAGRKSPETYKNDLEKALFYIQREIDNC